ncbi:MAG: hypothetical protein U0973_11700 [Xanthomonadaceae bacterium]|nr:hypothetical protein [Xanthomonadaceae bacterium]
MSTEPAKPSRLGHAVLDARGRAAKARKIERLLELGPTSQTIHLLEIGTGSGGIAHYFGTHDTLNCQVEAVDVTDTRQISDGFRLPVGAVFGIGCA